MRTFAQHLEEQLTVNHLKKALDKHGYSHDPEEIAYAFHNDKMATMNHDQIVKHLNKKGVTHDQLHKTLKSALNEETLSEARDYATAVKWLASQSHLGWDNGTKKKDPGYAGEYTEFKLDKKAMIAPHKLEAQIKKRFPDVTVMSSTTDNTVSVYKN